ncbi:cAMP-activated global transcriptional regulator CRP [compost metagenome]
MPSDTLDSLIFQGRLVEAKANTLLFQEGQAGNTCYIILQGSLAISQKGKLINQMNQGCVGEIALLMNGGIRTATIHTQTDAVLLELNQQSFYKVLAQNLILAKEIETLAASRLQTDQSRK